MITVEHQLAIKFLRIQQVKQEQMIAGLQPLSNSILNRLSAITTINDMTCVQENIMHALAIAEQIDLTINNGVHKMFMKQTTLEFMASLTNEFTFENCKYCGTKTVMAHKIFAIANKLGICINQECRTNSDKTEDELLMSLAYLFQEFVELDDGKYNFRMLNQETFELCSKWLSEIGVFVPKVVPSEWYIITDIDPIKWREILALEK